MHNDDPFLKRNDVNEPKRLLAHPLECSFFVWLVNFSFYFMMYIPSVLILISLMNISREACNCASLVMFLLVLNPLCTNGLFRLI